MSSVYFVECVQRVEHSCGVSQRTLQIERLVEQLRRHDDSWVGLE